MRNLTGNPIWQKCCRPLNNAIRNWAQVIYDHTNEHQTHCHAYLSIQQKYFRNLKKLGYIKTVYRSFFCFLFLFSILRFFFFFHNNSVGLTSFLSSFINACIPLENWRGENKRISASFFTDFPLLWLTVTDFNQFFKGRTVNAIN